jgi:hypothetical protein
MIGDDVGAMNGDGAAADKRDTNGNGIGDDFIQRLAFALMVGNAFRYGFVIASCSDTV